MWSRSGSHFQVPEFQGRASQLLTGSAIHILICQIAMAETKRTVVARLFAEHGGALQAFLYRRVRRRPDAAELAQEVYVRLLRVPDIEAIRDPGAYL